MLALAGLPQTWLPWFGAAELAMSLLTLALWPWRGMFVLQILLMITALIEVLHRSPEYLTHAFNPVTLNMLIVALAAIGFIASGDLPSARRCLRADPRRFDAGQEK